MRESERESVLIFLSPSVWVCQVMVTASSEKKVSASIAIFLASSGAALEVRTHLMWFRTCIYM